MSINGKANLAGFQVQLSRVLEDRQRIKEASASFLDNVTSHILN